MATTTPALIRDRASEVIKALAPPAIAGSRFREDRAEYGGDFRAWARGAGGAAFRRYQVRDIGYVGLPAISNMDNEELRCKLEVVVAYPQDHRAGAAAAYDRDALIDQDWDAINFAIGWCGRGNFPAGSAYDACWMPGTDDETKSIERDEGVDFLVLTLTYSYHRARS